MKILLLTASFLAVATAANAEVPALNANCPGNVTVSAAKGGPIYINGKEGKLRTINKNYYEATSEGITISLTVNDDAPPSVSYNFNNAAVVCVDAGPNPKLSPGQAPME